MRKNILLSVILAFVAMSLISAQDPDKILEKHFQAIGQKNLTKAKNYQATGKAVMNGMENPFKMISQRPGKVRIIVEFQGAEIVQGFDGETAWMINPMMGSSGAVVITGPEADGVIDASDMDGQLWMYKKKGHQLELAGSEKVGDKDVYVLKLTKKNGVVDRYYMDQESFLIHRLETSAVANGADIDVEVLLSNFQKVNGYMMPFTTVQKFNGQAGMEIIFDEVKFDVEADDSLFSKPN